MIKRVEEYVGFIMKQVVLFQEKNGDNLNVKDISAISRMVQETIYHGLESEEEIQIPLAYMIGNKAISTNLNEKAIRDEMEYACKVRLKRLREKIYVMRLLKDSPFLAKIRKSKNLLNEDLLKSIPAIECCFSKNGLKAKGYTSSSECETIYEFNKNDKEATIKENINLVSLKEVINNTQTQTKK